MRSEFKEVYPKQFVKQYFSSRLPGRAYSKGMMKMVKNFTETQCNLKGKTKMIETNSYKNITPAVGVYGPSLHSEEGFSVRNMVDFNK